MASNQHQTRLRGAGVHLLTCLLVGPASARDKTDIVELRNGDRITGEIKVLERGRLRLSTDAIGTIQIEWDDIAFVRSSYDFEFELSSGQRYFGRLAASEEPQRIGIHAESEDRVVDAASIVRIDPIEDRFVDRLTGSLSFGFGYTKASDVGQLNLGVDLTYREMDRSVSIEASSISTRDDDETTERSRLGIDVVRFRGNRWFTNSFATLESNDELGLNARVGLGFGGGRFLVKSNSAQFAVGGGLLGTRESLTGGAPSETSLEGLLVANYERYIYDDPNVNIATTLKVLPNLSDGGRWRAEFDAQVRYELIDDLFLDLSLYNSYDSDPPSGVSTTTDYGIATSLGWSF